MEHGSLVDQREILLPGCRFLFYSRSGAVWRLAEETQVALKCCPRVKVKEDKYKEEKRLLSEE